jgi:hypothetical protein
MPISALQHAAERGLDLGQIGALRPAQAPVATVRHPGALHF